MEQIIIFMRSVPGKPNHRALTIPLLCKKYNGDNGFVPAGFEWDGSSVPLVFQGFFPRHRHPISSCRHDYRCKNAKSYKERAWADKEFKKDVRTTSWWITALFGYIGVRIGAWLGVGIYF